MLAVLITISFSLRHTRSTHDTLPERIAVTVRSTVSQPMSLAKWLNVPAGNTASGTPVSTATAAAHDTVPSPPPTASTSARWAAARSAVSRIVVLAEFDDLGLRQLLPHLVDDPAPLPLPEAGLTTSTTPSPSGRSGASTQQRFGGRQLGGHDRRNQRPPSTAIAPPRCRSRRTRRRDNARRWPPGTGRPDRPAAPGPDPAEGSPDPTPTANAAALAEWPDGREFDVGMRRAASQRHRGAVRPRPLPHPLGELIGDQTGHRQRDDTATGAAARRRRPRRSQGGGDREPQLGVVGRAGQKGHRLVEQRARRFGDGLEHLAVQSPQPAVI